MIRRNQWLSLDEQEEQQRHVVYNEPFALRRRTEDIADGLYFGQSDCQLLGAR